LYDGERLLALWEGDAYRARARHVQNDWWILIFFALFGSVSDFLFGNDSEFKSMQR
jgi:hypothetical protein